MKIVADAGGDKKIVLMTDNEIAKLAGYEFAHDMPEPPAIGNDIVVSANWGKMEYLRGKKAQLANVATQLQQFADNL